MYCVLYSLKMFLREILLSDLQADQLKMFLREILLSDLQADQLRIYVNTVKSIWKNITI